MLANGKPLVEVYIGLAKGINLTGIIDKLNKLDDYLNAEEWVYNKMSGDNNLTIDATPEALKRVFGWEIERVKFVTCNPETKKWDKIVENLFIWEEKNKPTRFPNCLDGIVTDVGIPQPVRCDDGQPYN